MGADSTRIQVLITVNTYLVEDTEPLLDEIARTLVQQLNSKIPGERERAADTLRSLGPHVIPVMDVLLEAPLRDAKEQERSFRTAYWFLVSVTACLLLYPIWPFYSHWDQLFWRLIASFLAPRFLLAVFWLGNGFQGDSTQAPGEWLSSVALALIGSEESYAAIPLLEILYLHDASYMFKNPNRLDEQQLPAVRHAILRLLPRLQPEDRCWLQSRHRKCLLDVLRRYSDFVLNSGPGSIEDAIARGEPRTEFDLPMSLAILKLYSQIGKADALPYVRRLAKSSVRTPQAFEVREAALECLPTLQADADNHLLRPSREPVIPNTTLLRSSEQMTDLRDPEQLLRAHNSDKNA